MVSGPERHQVGVICGGRYRYAPGTPDVSVAHLISEHLQLISREVVVVPENMIVAGSTCAL